MPGNPYFLCPVINNFCDVFVAICDDKMEHGKTRVTCQQPDARLEFSSPHTQQLQPDGVGS